MAARSDAQEISGIRGGNTSALAGRADLEGNRRANLAAPVCAIDTLALARFHLCLCLFAMLCCRSYPCGGGSGSRCWNDGRGGSRGDGDFSPAGLQGGTGDGRGAKQMSYGGLWFMFRWPIRGHPRQCSGCALSTSTLQPVYVTAHQPPPHATSYLCHVRLLLRPLQLLHVQRVPSGLSLGVLLGR